MPGSENLSDLFTKEMEVETIDKHVHGTNCEFADGKDDPAYTMHFVGAGLDTSIFNDKVEKVLNLEGDHNAWTRTDLGPRRRESPCAEVQIGRTSKPD